jgi:hypothetical protein
MRHDGIRTETAQDMGARHLRESGYGKGGDAHPDAPQDRKLIRSMVKPQALKGEQKRAHGGMIDGATPKHRPDRKGRGPKTVNVIVGRGDGGGDGGQREQAAAQQGMRVGMAMAGRAASAAPHPPMAPPGGPPHPPMGPPVMGAGPGGPGGPGMPPQMARNGGSIKVRAHERRQAGGAI